MNKPNLIGSIQIPPLQIQKHERYLPTAFDETLSILEKINKVIHYLYEYSDLTEQMMGKWNEVYLWVMGEGLDDTVGERLLEWLNDGTFYRIINETIFNELNGKVESVINDFEVFKGELEKKFDELSDGFYLEMYQVGRTVIEWSD